MSQESQFTLALAVYEEKRQALLLPIESFKLRSVLQQLILQNLLCWE